MLNRTHFKLIMPGHTTNYPLHLEATMDIRLQSSLGIDKPVCKGRTTLQTSVNGTYSGNYRYFATSKQLTKEAAFILQAGSSIKVVPKRKSVKVPESYLSEAQDVLDDWLEANYWKEQEAEHVRCAIVDGELLLHLSRDEDSGEPQVRRFEPEMLLQPPGMTIQQGWRYGIQHRPGDVCKVLNYNINWELGLIGQQVFGTIVPADFVVHMKRNVVQSVARGISDFYSNADDFDKIDRILDAMGAGTVARSKIAYFRTHKDALGSTPRNFRNNNATSWSYDPLTGQQQANFVPTDGAIADIPDTVGVETMPQGNTLEAIEAINSMMRLCIANRWSMPEFIASADASNNNYASIMTAGAPYVLALRSEQTKFIDKWKQAINWVMKVKMVLGQVPMDFFDKCKIEITLADPAISDELEKAQIAQILIGSRVMSRTTAGNRFGLDRDQETEYMTAETESDPMLQVQLDAATTAAESAGENTQDKPKKGE
jgi:hypothetical protein